MQKVPRPVPLDDVDLFDVIEPFKVRAWQLSRANRMRLCEWCLRHRPRCIESMRRGTSRCWKEQRATPWRRVYPVLCPERPEAVETPANPARGA